MGCIFKPFNKHCKARPCKRPRPYDPDFGLSVSHLYRTGLTQKDQNLGRKVEVKYMNEPFNAC